MYSLRCIRLLYSLRCIGVQIRCVFVALNPPLVFVALNPPLVFVASASCIRCVALGYKFVALHLESLNICWNRSPCKNWGTNSLCRPSYCRSRLSSHGTWPIAYGALVPVEKSRIVGNAPRLWSPLTFVGIEVHAKIGVRIHCVGQVIVLPASRPVAYGLWSIMSGQKIEDCWKCSDTLESLNLCRNRRPCKNWSTNSLCRPSYCRSRLSSRGPWPI